MKRLKVHDWNHWQTYRKDRPPPPWIKIQRGLLLNQKWCDLSDSERGQLVSCWVLASNNNGILPSKPRLLRRMARLSRSINISRFIDLGFFEWVTDDANMTPIRRPNDALETETELKTERPPPLPPPVQKPFIEWFDKFWNCYPKGRTGRRVGKGAAERAWAKHILPPVDPANVIRRLVEQVEVGHFLGLQQGEVQAFVPLPTTWINQHRWEDELRRFTKPFDPGAPRSEEPGEDLPPEPELPEWVKTREDFSKWRRTLELERIETLKSKPEDGK